VPRFIPTAVIVLLILSPVGCVAAIRHSAEQRTLHVTWKERIDHGDYSQYRVFTDEGVFSVEDTWSFFNWDEAGRYNRLRIGHTYTCTVAGFRIRLTSSYENLIDCALVR
jgi:hypothetical protein